jgi:hypothetical protein
MIAWPSSRHFSNEVVKVTGLQYPNILKISQQKAGKRIFNEKKFLVRGKNGSSNATRESLAHKKENEPETGNPGSFVDVGIS